MGIPVIHNRAFGFQPLLNRGPRPIERGIRLGEPPGPTISQTEIDYNQAIAYYDGIKHNYGDLVTLIGERDAKAALDQAEAALKAWKAQQPVGR